MTMGSTTHTDMYGKGELFWQQNYFNNNNLKFHEDDKIACIINPRT